MKTQSGKHVEFYPYHKVFTKNGRSKVIRFGETQITGGKNAVKKRLRQRLKTYL